MTLKSLLARPWLTLGLIALILITRTNSASAMIFTPDVTLAAFFIAGLWIPSALVFALLFGAAALADQISFMLGMIDWCFTPAYVFLVPTYAALWFAGYFCRTTKLFSWRGGAKVAVSLTLACIVAYAISTYSFYLFSGRLVDERAIQAYKDGILHYFPNYIGWAAAYTAIALTIAFIAQALSERRKLDSTQTK